MEFKGTIAKKDREYLIINSVKCIVKNKEHDVEQEFVLKNIGATALLHPDFVNSTDAYLTPFTDNNNEIYMIICILEKV